MSTLICMSPTRWCATKAMHTIGIATNYLQQTVATHFDSVPCPLVHPWGYVHTHAVVTLLVLISRRGDRHCRLLTKGRISRKANFTGEPFFFRKVYFKKFLLQFSLLGSNQKVIFFHIFLICCKDLPSWRKFTNSCNVLCHKRQGIESLMHVR